MLKRLNIKIVFTLVLILLVVVNISSAEIYFRFNQAGYLPSDSKNAIIFSDQDLSGRTYSINEFVSKKNIIKAKLVITQKEEGSNYNYYTIDFSSITSPGRYNIVVDNKSSQPVIINDKIYNNITDSLLLFFKAQRCGYTDPILHKVCHPYDASRLIIDKKSVEKTIDITGGWHDAGDYVKFLNTTAFTTYMLIFSYEFDPEKFGFDNNKNGAPDILEEAKVGLDWLLRLNYQNNLLVTQVADYRDHEQGWRKPENDKLAFDRPAFAGIGKNTIGIYSAALALGSRIWREKLYYNEFADKCLSTAKNFYYLMGRAPDLDTSGEAYYRDKFYSGKAALGAIELYMATKDKKFLDDAKSFSASTNPDYWWSWGDINSLVFYRMAGIDSKSRNNLLKNISYFRDIMNKNIFNEAAQDNWGSNTAVLGAALQGILWNRLTTDHSFDGLIQYQRDFILGRNRWGISFIHNIGYHFSSEFHSQTAFFNNGYLPGAVAAGPISRKSFDTYKIKLTAKDRYSSFQKENSVYFDDRADYVTNEPTITTNATALFVMGFFTSRK